MNKIKFLPLLTLFFLTNLTKLCATEQIILDCGFIQDDTRVYSLITKENFILKDGLVYFEFTKGNFGQRRNIEKDFIQEMEESSVNLYRSEDDKLYEMDCYVFHKSGVDIFFQHLVTLQKKTNCQVAEGDFEKLCQDMGLAKPQELILFETVEDIEEKASQQNRSDLYLKLALHPDVEDSLIMRGATTRDYYIYWTIKTFLTNNPDTSRSSEKSEELLQMIQEINDFILKDEREIKFSTNIVFNAGKPLYTDQIYHDQIPWMAKVKFHKMNIDPSHSFKNTYESGHYLKNLSIFLTANDSIKTLSLLPYSQNKKPIVDQNNLAYLIDIIRDNKSLEEVYFESHKMSPEDINQMLAAIVERNEGNQNAAIRKATFSGCIPCKEKDLIKANLEEKWTLITKESYGTLTLEFWFASASHIKDDAD